MNPYRDVKEAYEKFGLGYEGPIRPLPRSTASFRHQFGIEELNEWYLNNDRALDARGGKADYRHALAEQLDAIVDQVYVTLGTAIMQGITEEMLAEAWDRVHAANMKKVRATSAEDSKRGSVLDIIKPLGWEAPNHLDLVEASLDAQG